MPDAGLGHDRDGYGGDDAVDEVGIAERSDRLVSILLMTGLADLLRLLGVGDGVMWLIPVTLAVLAVASTITVIQRILVVRRQALGLPPAAE